MPNKQEAVNMRMEAMKEALEDIEKIEDFLKKGAVELYTDIITPDIEHCVNDNLFYDIGIPIDCTTITNYTEEREKFFEDIASLKVKKININNFGQFLHKKENPILFFSKEDGKNIFYRRSYLQEIVEKNGYKLEYNKEEDVITISATIPKLTKDENGKVLIKKD